MEQLERKLYELEQDFKDKLDLTQLEISGEIVFQDSETILDYYKLLRTSDKFIACFEFYKEINENIDQKLSDSYYLAHNLSESLTPILEKVLVLYSSIVTDINKLDKNLK